MKSLIPNALTLLNLTCGVLILWIGILYELSSFNKETAFLLITLLLILATLADFLDGFLARKLHAESPIGKELDSLADMVSFGLTPFFLLALYFFKLEIELQKLVLLGFLFPILGSAYRLACFNVTHQLKGFFYGLPTPANAYLHIALYIGFHKLSIKFWESFLGPVIMFMWCMGITYLLITKRVKFLALKGNFSSPYRKRAFFLLILFSFFFIWWLKWFAGIPILVLYFLISQWAYHHEKI